MTVRGIVFDLDGVLVSTDEMHYRAWKAIADAEGIHFDRTINHRLRGVSRMESLAIVLERAHRAYTPEERQRLADRKNEVYRESLRALSPEEVLPGVCELLHDLRKRGLRLAVASSSRNARLIMKQTGLTGEFDAIVEGSDITHSKPHPEVFLLAAERLGLQPAECIVVEDAMAGVEAARAAGMGVFGIGGPENLQGVSHAAPSLQSVSADGLLRAGDPAGS